MTRIVQVSYRDDFSGKVVPEEDITEGFPYSVGITRYRLDATQETQDAIRNALAPFIERSLVVVGYGKSERYLTAEEYAIQTAPELPKVPETPASTHGESAGSTNGNGHTVTIVPPSNEIIRDWAKGQPELAGRVKDRGALPREITSAYMLAHA
jgi:hypothetical protein